MVNILSGHDDHRDAVTWLDVDDTMRETHRYAKQGVGYGYNKVKGLNALLGMVSTAVSAPVIVGHRLRQGTVSSARRAGKFLSDAIAAARRLDRPPVVAEQGPRLRTRVRHHQPLHTHRTLRFRDGQR